MPGAASGSRGQKSEVSCLRARLSRAKEVIEEVTSDKGDILPLLKRVCVCGKLAL